MVEVKKRQNETAAAMIRRFSRKVQQSGVLISARKNRFHAGKLSKRKTREKALRRAKYFKEKEKMEKLGKISENKFQRR